MTQPTKIDGAAYNRAWEQGREQGKRDAADEIERLLAAIQRIDGLNDNPSQYNSAINDVCSGILRQGKQMTQPDAMSDDELAKYLHLSPAEAEIVIPKLTPQRRAVYDRMRQVEIETALWIKGLGPKPQGVLIDRDRRRSLDQHHGGGVDLFKA
jgi:hypothetical protein